MKPLDYYLSNYALTVWNPVRFSFRPEHGVKRFNYWTSP
nr:MAG TPA: hypothetical protein [Caudoviricetes sp.]